MAKKPKPEKPLYENINAWVKVQPGEEQKELQKTLRDLKRLFQKEDRFDFQWWHRVGGLVEKLFPRSDKTALSKALSEER